MSILSVFLIMFGLETSMAQPILKIEKKTSADGVPQLCVKEFATASDPECFTLRNFTTFELACSSALARLDRIEVTELATRNSESGTKFILAVDWSGRSAGMLEYAGPKGKTFAIGTLKDAKVMVTSFVDAEFTQLFDRAVLFGTSQSELSEVTLAWLNEVVGPFLEAYSKADVELRPKD